MKNKARKKIIKILLITAFFYMVAVFADFVAPYCYDTEMRSKSYLPPVKIHFFSEEGKFSFRPFVYNIKYSFDENYRRVFVEDTTNKYPIRFFARGESYSFFGLFNSNIHLFGVDKPAVIYLFGADSRGRDIFSRICFSLRVSLSVGILGVFVSYAGAIILGGIAGFYGGKIDFVVMRLCEMVMLLPGFYIMLALRSSFPADMSSLMVYVLIVCIFSVIGWASIARVIRGMVHSIKREEFVMAAHSLGVSDFRIMFKHILPHVFSYTIISAAMTMPSYILGESALSMLGLGIQEPFPSLGNMLSDALNISEISFHSWLLTPGLVIVLIVVLFNMLGESIRDYHNIKVWQ